MTQESQEVRPHAWMAIAVGRVCTRCQLAIAEGSNEPEGDCAGDEIKRIEQETNQPDMPEPV